MRLVKIKLREPNPFWILSPIHLKKDDEISPMINADALNEQQVNIINHSIRLKEISLIDSEGNLVNGNLNSINVFNGNYVSTDDIEEEKDVLPEIISVTAPLETDEDEEEQEEITEEIYENAKILLKKNGNTIKKTIRNLANNSDNLLFLHACLELEETNSKREGIILTIQEKMMES